ncbi:RNA 2',3'-cyclic phosphodiesterase [Aliiglaciecola sp. 3_MG-2023]|uniref:RNA 2',3'-cyclic phosphodiesterase n=1 Tax=Aliiglaciecola sp. 3_MG-2023 TaxID=3062644 RepID=UPI0026E18E9C|nr:RNA 2',3'-cyclic phosphodiesterase [Aliiglaciecola sp. 3_MG-2023]MDO6692097.1 RNA 2',3'-cyclic phosphodiesterase [Aliiglaciecola sp. 3_MG-2023]
MRYFLGFDLESKSKIAIDDWRNKALPKFERAVPAKNFHITSVFLGQVKEQQLDQLCCAIQSSEFHNFNLQIDTLGYWSKPKILWLGSTQIPTQMLRITKRLTEYAQQAGLNLPIREYIPHITLVRNAKSNPPAPLISPDFQLQVKHLHLFESVSGKNGVQYPIRQTWPLHPSIRPR